MSSASMEATSSGISGCPAASAMALILSRGKIAYLLSSYNFLSSDIADNPSRDLANRGKQIFRNSETPHGRHCVNAALWEVGRKPY